MRFALNNGLELPNGKGILKMSHVKDINRLDFFYSGTSLLAGNCRNSALDRQHTEKTAQQGISLCAVSIDVYRTRGKVSTERSSSELELNDTNAIQ